MTETLLFNSESLTREENDLRIELIQWARTKYLAGNRPVSITAALKCAGQECLEDGSVRARLIFQD